jgi:xanthine dehydrogenase accessory factor
MRFYQDIRSEALDKRPYLFTKKTQKIFQINFMKEIRTIITAYDTIDPNVTKVALATVVRVEGSSYRRTGARMLVQDNGTWEGGISGGCLEGDALKQARMAIFKDSPTLITYDTTQDDEHQIGVGLGCNGIIDVLFTPLKFSDKSNPVEVLKHCVSDIRKTHTLLTTTQTDSKVNGLETGQAIEYKNEESLSFISDELLRKSLVNSVLNQQTKGNSAPITIELPNGECSVFIELIPPPIHLVIMGHQYDVFPLSRLINELGWEATIVAPKVKVNQKISSLVSNVLPVERFSEIEFDEYTAVVLMSHDFEKDKANLTKVLDTKAPYIGMLGPRVRSERIWQELSDENFEISDENQERIYAPVGLDIGAVSPEEIALSLISEIRAVFSGREGNSLRLRNEPIHERT